MRALTAIVTLFLLVSAAGCSFRKKPQAKAVPPPPPPTRASVPVPDVPLSIPQTTVQLPPQQPVDPAAVRVDEPQTLPPPPELDHPSRPPRRAPVPAAALPPPKPEVLEPPKVEERPRLQEILSHEEQRRLAEEIAARMREINQTLEQASTRNLSEHEKNIVERVKSFVQLSDQAAGRGEMRQAEALSERALVLARELRGVR